MVTRAKIFNRVKHATATTGTGTMTLGSASSGYLSASEAGVADGDYLTYTIEDGNDFEMGYGTYTASGTTLSRDSVVASKVSGTAGTSKLNLSGSATVILVPLAKGLQRPLMVPQGRLSTVTGTPVLTTTQSAKTTTYWTPYIGQLCPIYDGSDFWMADLGGELSQATTDTTKSPAAVTTDSNYDTFVWDDSGTFRATRGPAWTSATDRGTGAGTSELTRLRGILVNTNAITNGPAANKGTYVGTIRTNGSSQVDWIYGAAAAGGTAGFAGIFNAYNRVDVGMTVCNSTNTWTYGTAAWRAVAASNAMRVSYVMGLEEDIIDASYLAIAGVSTGSTGAGAVGYDSTTTPGALGTWSALIIPTAGVSTAASAARFITTSLGFHYMQALEQAPSGASVTFYGSNGGATYPYDSNGLQVRFRA